MQLSPIVRTTVVVECIDKLLLGYLLGTNRRDPATTGAAAASADEAGDAADDGNQRHDQRDDLAEVGQVNAVEANVDAGAWETSPRNWCVQCLNYWLRWAFAMVGASQSSAVEGEI